MPVEIPAVQLHKEPVFDEIIEQLVRLEKRI